jgi:hypothetical protein
MKKLVFIAGLALAGVLASAQTAAAHGSSSTTCNGSLSNVAVRSLTVPSDGVCTLDNVRVKGDVKVLTDGYLQVTGSSVSGDVAGRKAQTIFVEDNSTIAGDIDAYRTDQVFLFGSRVGGFVEVNRASDKVNICGMALQYGAEIQNSRRDILVGDPLAIDCPGNFVLRGDLRVEDNFTDVELIVGGNSILRGDLVVRYNDGSSDKAVRGNLGGYRLVCRGNDDPFASSGNADFDKKYGQCS